MCEKNLLDSAPYYALVNFSNQEDPKCDPPQNGKKSGNVSLDDHQLIKYRYVGPKRRKQIRPVDNLSVPKMLPMDNKGTVYKTSYMSNTGHERCRPIGKRKSMVNITNPNEPMENRTVSRTSYKAIKHYPEWKRVKRSMNLFGSTLQIGFDREFRSMTTNKHDFVPKRVRSLQQSKGLPKVDNIHVGTGPMANHTTTGDSYQPKSNTEKLKPINSCDIDHLGFSDEKMDANTIQKLSFGPIGQDYFPYKVCYHETNKYEPPKLKLDSNTTYSLSYEAPGYYQEYYYEPTAMNYWHYYE